MKKLFFYILLLNYLAVAAQKSNPCDPALLIGDYKNGDTISVADVLKLTGIAMYHPCKKIITRNINQFEFTIIIPGKALSLIGIGRSFTDKMKKGLANVTVGSKIIVDMVSTKDKAGIITSMRGATLIVGLRSSITQIDTAK